MDPDVDRFAYYHGHQTVGMERDYWDRQYAVRSRKRNPYPSKQDTKVDTRFQRKDAQSHYNRAKRSDDCYKECLEADDEAIANRKKQGAETLADSWYGPDVKDRLESLPASRKARMETPIRELQKLKNEQTTVLSHWTEPVGSGENRKNQYLPLELVEEITRRSCRTEAPDPPLAQGKVYPPKGSERAANLKKYGGAVLGLGGSALLGGAYLLGGKTRQAPRK